MPRSVHYRVRLYFIAALALVTMAVPFAAQQTPTFGSLTQLVPLYATVLDKHKNSIASLKREDFRVFEDEVPQKIKDFRREDVPVSICIVVDNSGSMREKRLRVAAAAMTFVKTSNPQDEVCIVNFNEDYYLDRDFTSNPDDLKDALEKIDSRGGTAFYDSLIASMDHLRDSGRKVKKVLLVVTDGVDNASRSTLEQTERAAHESDVVIYTIGLFSDERGRDVKRAKRALDTISEASGGLAFFPNDVHEVEAIATQIAHDIRNQYVITYTPATESPAGTFHKIRVEATQGKDKLLVRTRTGYYTPKKMAGSN